MNYLAHIQLADFSESSLVGNFLGDFVKGADLSHLPPAIEHGIWLHRQIDTFTDAHPLVRQLKGEFPRTLRRMAGVVLDVYFDHLLCRHWQTFSARGLAPLLDDFYQQLEAQPLSLPGRFNVVRDSLLQHRWLSNYQSFTQCMAAFGSIERRLGGRIRFASEANIFIHQHQQNIEHQFMAFYPQLMRFVVHKSDHKKKG